MTRANNSPYNPCCEGKFVSAERNLCDICNSPLPNKLYPIGEKIRYELDGVTVKKQKRQVCSQPHQNKRKNK